MQKALWGGRAFGHNAYQVGLPFFPPTCGIKKFNVVITAPEIVKRNPWEMRGKCNIIYFSHLK